MTRRQRRTLRHLRALYGLRLVLRRNHASHLWRWSVREILDAASGRPIYGPSIATGETRAEALSGALRPENVAAFKPKPRRRWREPVVLLPGPASFDSPELHAAIARPIPGERR